MPTPLKPLIPRQAVPGLRVPLLSGQSWSMADQTPEHFTMIVFYRGLHCPLCGLYLKELDEKLSAFADHGTSVIAISSDTHDRAEQAKVKWGLGSLDLGYDLSLDTAREWGLFLSDPRGNEPRRFSEPGTFFVRPDGTLYASIVQTMPFTRPDADDLLRFLDFVIKNDYPARGEVL